MALTTTVKTSNMNANSQVAGEVIVILSANLAETGSLFISKTITDMTAYTANQTTADADIKEFEDAAIAWAKGAQA